MFNNEPRKKALVIAISEYGEKSGLKPLKFCETGGKEMIALLKKLEFTIAKENELVGNISGSLLRKRIFRFFQDPETLSTDTLLFYFSGHGVLKGNLHYFGTSDMDARVPGEVGMLTAEMRNLAENCGVKCVIVVLDCCYARAAAGVTSLAGDLADMETIRNKQDEESVRQGEGRCFMYASPEYAQAFATEDEKYSFFTKYLLLALEGSKESVNEKGEVTAITIQHYFTKILDNLPSEDRDLHKPKFSFPDIEGEIILARHPKLAKPDATRYLEPYLLALKSVKSESNEQRSILLEMLLKVRLTQSFLDEQSTFSSLFDSYQSKMNDRILLTSGKEIDDANWSFDDKKNSITNKTLWKGIQLRRTIKANSDLTDFWFKFEKDPGGNIVATYQPEGPGDTGTAVVNEQLLPKVGKVFVLNYLGSIGSKYFDLLKIIDENTIIGKCYVGGIKSSNLCYDYVLTRTYALEYMTESDHEFLLNKQKIPKNEMMKGIWEVRIINDFSVKVPPLYFRLKDSNGNIEISYFVEDPTLLSDGLDVGEKEARKLGTEKIDKFRTLSDVVLLGTIDVDFGNLKMMIPQITEHDCRENPMRLRCILKKI